MTSTGMHVAHCCARHGCKYATGDADELACPVYAGDVAQNHPCEQCDDEIEHLGDLPWIMNALYERGWLAGVEAGIQAECDFTTAGDASGYTALEARGWNQGGH